MCCRVTLRSRAMSVLSEGAVAVKLGGITVQVCSLESLLEMKRASGRALDIDDVEALQEANRQE